jgi:hypothetical protein
MSNNKSEVAWRDDLIKDQSEVIIELKKELEEKTNSVKELTELLGESKAEVLRTAEYWKAKYKAESENHTGAVNKLHAKNTALLKRGFWSRVFNLEP